MQLGQNLIRVWVVQLDDHDPVPLLGLLSEDERKRAARLAVPQARRRFVVARGLLRRILSSVLDGEPSRLVFVYGTRGKPSLDASQSRGLHFNLAHSEGLALYALAWGREVGVDLERLRPLPDAAALAAKFFAPEEQAALQALPPAARHEGFFRIWARKEAFVKARGEGIAAGLSRFAVSCDPQSGGLLYVAGEPQAAARWRIVELDLAAFTPAYLAALAAPGDWQVLLNKN